MTNPYFTAAEFKVRTNKTISDDDALIDAYALAISEWLDLHTNRQRDGFIAASTATTRLFSGSGKTYQWIDECVEVTLVEVKPSAYDTTYTAWASADWIAATGDPEAPTFGKTPYQFILVDPTGDQNYFTNGRYLHMRGFRPDYDDVRGKGAPTVRVTAKWGYAITVPYAIKEAAVAMAARLFKQGEAAYADILGNPETGQLIYRESVPKIVQTLISRLQKPTLGR